MAYAAIQPRNEFYNNYTINNPLRRSHQSGINLYLPKDITNAIIPQETQSRKYPISKLSCLGQYRNNDGKPAYKLPTLPLQDYMGGKRTYPTHSSHLQHSSYSANSLKSTRQSYSKK